MNNVTFVTDLNNVDHAIIDLGNGEFLSMPKTEYDTLPSNSSTPQAGA